MDKEGLFKGTKVQVSSCECTTKRTKDPEGLDPVVGSVLELHTSEKRRVLNFFLRRDGC